MSLKLGHWESKTRSLGQILGKPCRLSRSLNSGSINLKIGQNDCLNKISDWFEIGSLRSKTRSLGQILGKPCRHSRSHNFGSINLKIGQNDFLNKILCVFKMWTCGVKNQDTRSNLRKTLQTLQKPRFWLNPFEFWSECLSQKNLVQV